MRRLSPYHASHQSLREIIHVFIKIQHPVLKTTSLAHNMLFNAKGNADMLPFLLNLSHQKEDEHVTKEERNDKEDEKDAFIGYWCPAFRLNRNRNPK